MIQCDFCGAKAPIIKKQPKALVVAINSSSSRTFRPYTFHCHGSYVTAETARELDRIRKNRRRVGKAKRVLVASFKKSAA